MSLPRQSNAPSSSPSKPSLRRSSGSRNPSSQSLGPTTHFAEEAKQHHFLPHSPPNQNLEFEEDDEEAVEGSGRSHLASQSLPPQPFQPFFTLIEDPVNNEHYHPTVHYIFADDDAEIITEAACRSLEQERDEIDPDSQSATASRPVEEEEAEIESRLPRLIPDVKEHYVILDVQPTQRHGYSPEPSTSPSAAMKDSWAYIVSSAQSLSSDWQILRSQISNAPTMGEQEVGEEGLMLRIEGRRNTPPDQQVKDHKQEKETLEEMVERFQKRLSEIRQLVDVSELETHHRTGRDELDEQD